VIAPTTTPMASPSQNLTPRLYHAVDVGPALAIFAAAVATFLVVAMALGPGTLGLVGAQSIGLLATTVLATRWLTGGIGALGVGAPNWRALVGAAVIGAAFWYVNLRISLPVARLTGGEPELTRFQTRWLDNRELGMTIATLAVVPGLCEEILCRGLLARALAARHPSWFAAIVSAAAFSLLHMSIPRALPTFTLGLVLAWLALAANSVWPAVIAHVINNAIAIAITQGALDPLATAISDHPDPALAVAGATTLLGGYLVISGQRNHQDTRT
jgi:membrane protease YdiL (CAAX protease family)